MEKNKTNYGIFAVLIKLGPKIFAVITKVLKSAKLVKAGLAVGSLASYTYLFNWKFAAIIMTMLFVHESGHVWAMRRKGIKTKGFYFIPFLGGAAVAEESFRTRSNESYVALMGPIWGLILSAFALVCYLIWESPLLAAAAGWMALINLINLLPVNPLDGGRIIKSLILSMGLRTERYRKSAIITLIVISSIFLTVFAIMHVWIFFILGIIGLFEIIFELKKKSNMEPIPSNQLLKHFIGFLFVAIALYFVMFVTKHLPGSDVAMHVLTN